MHEQAAHPDSKPLARISGAFAVDRSDVAAMVKAGLLGGLVLGALAKAVPGAPYGGFAVAGCFVGLSVPREARASLAATAVGLLGAVAVWQLGSMGLAPVTVFVVLPLATIGASLAAARLKRYVGARMLVVGLLVFLMLSFLVQAASFSGAAARYFAVEPKAETYGFDTVMFVKTVHLMDRGVGFYEAYGRSHSIPGHG